MPGFNGTGPLGRGSMTGRRRGYCVLPGEKAAPYAPLFGPMVNWFSCRPWYGLGLRFRRGGRGRRIWW